MANNFYDTLGVSKTASDDEIKKAFRKKAHEFHPDKGNGSAEKFKEINEAYQVLSDASKRQQYDQYGQTFSGGGKSSYGSSPFGGGDPFGGFSGFGNGGVEFDLGDIFGDIFGGSRQRSAARNRGIDLEMGIKLNFEEAVFGVEKNIVLEKRDTCKTCSGTGAQPGSKVITCPKCHGQGQIRTQRRTIFGNVASSIACDRCEGTGKVPEKACHTCSGSGSLRQEKTISVKIPAGISDGQRVRVVGEGEAGYRGSEPGDLYLAVKVASHREFARDGNNLLKDQPISFTQAALGAKITLATFDGKIELKIPAGTQSGAVFKVGRRGVPHINNNASRGDLLVTARVVVPKKLSKKEKELLKQLAQERGESVEIDDGLWQNIRDSF